MGLTLTLPNLSQAFEDLEKKQQVAFYNALPKDHSLCIVDFEEAGDIKVGVYLKDPEKYLDILLRSEDAPDEESLYSDFYSERCKHCEYYYDTKTEEDEEEDEYGALIEISKVIHSPCRSYRDGLEDVFGHDTECLNGHSEPSIEDYQESGQIISNGYIWDKDTIMSSPLYFEFRYNKDGYVEEPMVSISEAYQLCAPESGDKIYYIANHQDAFNMYGHDAPNNICYGDTQKPVSFHLEEIAAAYQTSVYNDDLLKANEYSGLIDQLSNITDCIEDADSKDTDEEFQEVIKSDLLHLGSLFPDKERDEYVISSDWEGEKVDAVMILDSRTSSQLYCRIHSSGVKPVNKFQGFLTPSIYRLYEYKYVNPADPTQFIYGYVTEPNSAGYCWFFVDRKKAGQNSAVCYSSELNKCINNVLICFGQIQK